MSPWIDEKAESIILGCLMNYENRREVDLTSVHEEYFGIAHNRTIFGAMLHCVKNGYALDAVTIWDTLVKMNASFDIPNNLGYLNLCTISAVSSTMFKPALDSVVKLWTRRNLYQIFTAARDDIQNEKIPIPSVIETAESSIYRVVTETSDSDINRKEELAEEHYQKSLTGIDLITTGLSDLDERIGGLAPEELILLAGRPGMGKTAVALTSFIEVSKIAPALFFQLDMGSLAFWHRLLSYYTGFNLKKFRSTAGSKPQWTEAEKVALAKARDAIVGSNMYIETYPRYTITLLRQQIRQQVQNKGIKVVYVDHIGKIVPQNTHESRERQVGHIAEELKRIAKEFNVVIVGLSQLSRGVEFRDDKDKSGHKRPTLSDLRDSGALEQEADIVLMCYRPEYYGVHYYEDHTPATGTMSLQIEKMRNGQTGECRLIYDAPCTRVIDSASNKPLVLF